MGLLDQLAGQVLGQLAGGNGGQNNLLQGVMEMISNGGLNGLLEKFQQAGLGDQAASWVSTGQNLPVSAEQVQNALGNGAIGDLASRFGLSPDQASGALADLLPQVVDKLTPDGNVAQGDALQQGLAALASQFFK